VGSGRKTGERQGGVTAALARFAAQPPAFPGAVRHEASRSLLNMLACMHGGMRHPTMAPMIAVFSADDVHARAAFLGAAANALDFDDTHVATVLHPGPPVAGALLALAEHESVSGADFLKAYALGLETACRIANAVSPGHYSHGWHITSTCGVYGAAIAAAVALRLSERQVHAALGIAATQASGLVEMLGTGASAVNCAFAARNGVAAALLARASIAAPAEPLEGRRGFFNVFGVDARPERVTDQLGSDWQLMRVAYKPYPAGVVLHALIDACLAMRSSAPPAKIALRLHPLAIERADRPEPRDGAEARLSAQHCVAVALLYGAAGVEQFTDAVAADPQVRALRSRVTITADEGLDKAAVVVNIDGREKHAELRLAMSDAELEAKVRALAGPHADECIEWARSLESAASVRLPSGLSRRPRSR
jgi:2-methylcitrate dehydratase PrpD